MIWESIFRFNDHLRDLGYPSSAGSASSIFTPGTLHMIFLNPFPGFQRQIRPPTWKFFHR